MAGAITSSEPPWTAPSTGTSPNRFDKLITELRREGADPVRRSRPRNLPPEDRVPLVAAYWRTNLALRWLAPVSGTSKSAADRVVDEVVWFRVPARTSGPTGTRRGRQTAVRAGTGRPRPAGVPDGAPAAGRRREPRGDGQCPHRLPAAEQRPSRYRAPPRGEPRPVRAWDSDTVRSARCRTARILFRSVPVSRGVTCPPVMPLPVPWSTSSVVCSSPPPAAWSSPPGHTARRRMLLRGRPAPAVRTLLTPAAGTSPSCGRGPRPGYGRPGPGQTGVGRDRSPVGSRRTTMPFDVGWLLMSATLSSGTRTFVSG